MIGIKHLVASGVVAVMGMVGVNSAQAYEPYCAPVRAYPVRYSPVYVPAPVYYALRPVVSYCPPPPPVYCPPPVCGPVYRPAPVVCAPRVYTPYEWRHRNSVSVSFGFGGRW